MKKKNIAENFYNRARLDCLKGDKSNALIDLKKAFIMNPELKEWAKQDADLNNLHENEYFKDGWDKLRRR